MAFARDSYTASASQTDFTITFPYLAATDVYVSVDGTTIDNDADADTSSYQIVSSTTVRIGAGLTGGEVVVILRKTSQSSRLVDYASASTLTEEDLDNDSLQAFYMAQEAIDSAGLALNLGTNDQFDAVGLQINEVADPTAAQDAATKEYVDEVLVASGNVPSASETEDGDVLVVSTEGSIAWAELGEAYIPDGVIDGAMIEDLAVNTEHLVDESVTGAKIEDAAVDEEHFAEEAVATADIADAAVTAAKLDAEIAGLSAEGGSEGQVLTNEEGTTVAWAAADSGGYALLEDSGVLSAVGTYTFDGDVVDISTYKRFRLVFRDVSSTSAGAELYLRVQDNGSDETNNYHGNTFDDAGENGSTGSILLYAATQGAATSHNGWVDIWYDATLGMVFFGGFTNGSSPACITGIYDGGFGTLFNGLTVAQSGGNFDGGSRFLLYGAS